jgi:hypothetical protein
MLTRNLEHTLVNTTQNIVIDLVLVKINYGDGVMHPNLKYLLTEININTIRLNVIYHMGRCTRCHKLKSTAAFYTQHRTICKGCLCAYFKKYYEKNHGKCINNQHKYYQKNKDQINSRSRKHYWSNHDQVLDYFNDYRKKHREKIRARHNELSRIRYHRRKQSD